MVPTFFLSFYYKPSQANPHLIRSVCKWVYVYIRFLNEKNNNNTPVILSLVVIEARLSPQHNTTHHQWQFIYSTIPQFYLYKSGGIDGWWDENYAMQ